MPPIGDRQTNSAEWAIRQAQIAEQRAREARQRAEEARHQAEVAAKAAREQGKDPNAAPAVQRAQQKAEVAEQNAVQAQHYADSFVQNNPELVALRPPEGTQLDVKHLQAYRAAVGVVTKHVEAGTSRRQQHGVASDGDAGRCAHRRFE